MKNCTTGYPKLAIFSPLETLETLFYDSLPLHHMKTTPLYKGVF